MKKKQTKLIACYETLPNDVSDADFQENGWYRIELWENNIGYMLYVHRSKSGAVLYHKRYDSPFLAGIDYGRLREVLSNDYSAEECGRRRRHLLWYLRL